MHIKKISQGGGRGGAVAEWPKALLVRENINENQKIPGSPPAWAPLKKISLSFTMFPNQAGSSSEAGHHAARPELEERDRAVLAVRQAGLRRVHRAHQDARGHHRAQGWRQRGETLP